MKRLHETEVKVVKKTKETKETKETLIDCIDIETNRLSQIREKSLNNRRFIVKVTIPLKHPITYLVGLLISGGFNISQYTNKGEYESKYDRDIAYSLCDSFDTTNLSVSKINQYTQDIQKEVNKLYKLKHCKEH